MSDASNAAASAAAPKAGAAGGGFSLHRMTSMLRRGEILLALGVNRESSLS